MLEKAFRVKEAELDDSKISGKTKTLKCRRNEMIPSLLNIAEEYVLERPIKESIKQTKHKILDRLLAIHLL